MAPRRRETRPARRRDRDRPGRPHRFARSGRSGSRPRARSGVRSWLNSLLRALVIGTSCGTATARDSLAAAREAEPTGGRLVARGNGPDDDAFAVLEPALDLGQGVGHQAHADVAVLGRAI